MPVYSTTCQVRLKYIESFKWTMTNRKRSRADQLSDQQSKLLKISSTLLGRQVLKTNTQFSKKSDLGRDSYYCEVGVEIAAGHAGRLALVQMTISSISKDEIKTFVRFQKDPKFWIVPSKFINPQNTAELFIYSSRRDVCGYLLVKCLRHYTDANT